MTASLLPPPNEIGAPKKFIAWRHNQDLATEQLITAKTRFDVLALPTGMGKSLSYMTYGIFDGGRVVVLTSTRGLQDQLMADFNEVGLVDVRGMGNYPCKVLTSLSPKGYLQLGLYEEGCDDGPCLDGEPCSLREGGCYYFDAVARAKAAQLAVTNYSFWFTQRKLGRKFDDISVLICDEAHEIPDEMAGYLRVTLNNGDVRFVNGCHRWDIEQWASWAVREGREVSYRIKSLRAGSMRRRLREVKQRLDRLAAADANWVIEQTKYGWTFEPIWSAPYMEEWLFQGIPHVVMSSATVRPKSLAYMGLKPKDYTFVEYPSPVPVRLRPVYHLPTISLNHRTTEANLMFWVNRIDQIIKKRLDRKGIIHTVSYARAQFLKQHSEYGHLMLVHETKTARQVVAAFKQADAPSILVSPSVHTGYDFPYEQCRYQIIGKVPYPDTRSAIMQARMAQDKDYAAFLTMVTLNQMIGRGNRAEDDWCENFIVDDSIRWIMAKYSDFATRAMREAYKSIMNIPDPPRLDRAA